MNNFDSELQRRLAAIREQGLFRELRCVDSAQGPRIEIGGRSLLNFSSNDYLGLANHPAIKEAASKAVAQFGAGSGASRLLCGSLAPHHELEEALAAFKGTEAALSFSTGYAAALGTITALLGKEDVLVVDKLIHACVVDAAKLCGARLRIFAHNDLNELEDILRWADSRHPQPGTNLAAEAPRPNPHTLIVTESVFSMDGDHAPLREIVALKEKYGAWLMVDEAHATGLYGAKRRGLAEELAISDRIEVQMGTLGKALGASGGYICGNRTLIDYLINRARSFIFSTAPVPAAAAAARAAIELIKSEEVHNRCNWLWRLIEQLEQLFEGRPWEPHEPESAIIPILIGDETLTMSVASSLRSAGVFVPGIRYPTVARGQARLRITLTATHTPDDIYALDSALAQSQIVNRKS